MWHTHKKRLIFDVRKIFFLELFYHAFMVVCHGKLFNLWIVKWYVRVFLCHFSSAFFMDWQTKLLYLFSRVTKVVCFILVVPGKLSDGCQGVTYDVLRDVFPSISTPKLTLCKRNNKNWDKKPFYNFLLS